MFLDLDQLAKISNMRLYCQTSSYTDSCSIEKGYKCIYHAYTALKQNDELYFADAISNLRKAINYRVSELFSNLGVDNLSLPLGKDRRFEKLELLGIVKPLLLHKLLIVRNGIEYNFETPPCKAECEELADVVWYFYKSTDRLCSNRPYSWLMEWQEDGFECFIDFEIDFEKHEVIKFYGRFPQRYLSEQETNKSIPLSNVNIKNRAEQKCSAEHNLHGFLCEAEIETKMMRDYIELLSYCLDKF